MILRREAFLRSGQRSVFSGAERTAQLLPVRAKKHPASALQAVLCGIVKFIGTAGVGPACFLMHITVDDLLEEIHQAGALIRADRRGYQSTVQYIGQVQRKDHHAAGVELGKDQLIQFFYHIQAALFARAAPECRVGCLPLKMNNSSSPFSPFLRGAFSPRPAKLAICSIPWLPFRIGKTLWRPRSKKLPGQRVLSGESEVILGCRRSVRRSGYPSGRPP